MISKCYARAFQWTEGQQGPELEMGNDEVSHAEKCIEQLEHK